MAKKIQLGISARKSITAGVDFLADAVQMTIGPNGQNFLLEKGKKITNDGKIIASEMEHEDEIANEAIGNLRKAGFDTEAEVFDMSSSSIALGRAIYKELIKQLPNDKIAVGKMTVGEILKKVDEEVKEINQKIADMGTPIISKEMLIEATTVSTEDKNLGELIGSAQWELGKDGRIIAEETLDPECSIEMVSGILIDNGLVTSQVINNPEKQSLEVKDTSVVLTSHTIIDLKVLEPLIISLNKSGRKNLVLVARAFSENAINSCMEYMKSGFNIWPVNGPYVNQVEILKDLSSVLGGRALTQENSDIADVQLSDVGFAEHISVKRGSSIFTGKINDQSTKRVEARVSELKSFMEGNISRFEKKNYENRIAQLSTGFAIIHVGHPSEAERKRLKDKADDAVGTSRIALESGVVPGGGLTLKMISDSLGEGHLLKMPLNVIYDQIMSTSPEGFVIAEWVKDPVRTLQTAVKYAASAAATLATAGGAIVTKKEKPRLMQEVE